MICTSVAIKLFFNMILNNAEWDTKRIFLFLGKSLKKALILSDILDSETQEKNNLLKDLDFNSTF